MQSPPETPKISTPQPVEVRQNASGEHEHEVCHYRKVRSFDRVRLTRCDVQNVAALEDTVETMANKLKDLMKDRIETRAQIEELEAQVLKQSRTAAKQDDTDDDDSGWSSDEDVDENADADEDEDGHSDSEDHGMKDGRMTKWRKDLLVSVDSLSLAAADTNDPTIQDRIRKHTFKLMGRFEYVDEDGDIAYSPLPDSPYKPWKYLPDGVNDFTLAWELPMRRAYNKAAATEFTKSFLETYATFYTFKKNSVEIRKAFVSHARYLITRKKREQDPKQKKRGTSKKELYDSRRRRRCTVCDYCPSTFVHHPLIRVCS